MTSEIDKFEELLEKHLPKKNAVKDESQKNFEIYGVNESYKDRFNIEQKTALLTSKDKQNLCNCINSKNNKPKLKHFTLNEAQKHAIDTNEQIYVCPQTLKFRIYHTTSR